MNNMNNMNNIIQYHFVNPHYNNINNINIDMLPPDKYKRLSIEEKYDRHEKIGEGHYYQP